MQDYQTWHELLSDLIKNPRERKRIARSVGVEAETLLAWSRNAGLPDIRQLHALLQAIPRRQMLLHTLIAEEFDGFDLESINDQPNTPSVAFAAHLLDLAAKIPDESRFWSICTAILAEAVKQLDPDKLGISLSIAQCMPSREGNVYCLREYIGLGTSPWLDQVEMRTLFLGAESLAGDAISSSLPQIVDNIHQGQRPAINLPEHAVSTAAFPIMYGDRTAGCLLIASTQANYFSSASRQELIQSYKTMLTLAFSPDNFYAHDQIALQIMPAFEMQQPYLSSLQQRILATLKVAFSANRSIDYLEAQQYVYSQIAEELVQMHPQPGL